MLKALNLDIGQGAKRTSSKDKSLDVVGCELFKKDMGNVFSKKVITPIEARML